MRSASGARRSSSSSTRSTSSSVHDDLEKVMAFVGDAAQQSLSVRPPIFPVSARLADRAKHGEPSLWEASGFAALERYLHDSLDERGRFRLKLTSPLGVGDVLARRYLVGGRRASRRACERRQRPRRYRAAACRVPRRSGERIRAAHARRRAGPGADGIARACSISTTRCGSAASSTW